MSVLVAISVAIAACAVVYAEGERRRRMDADAQVADHRRQLDAVVAIHASEIRAREHRNALLALPTPADVAKRREELRAWDERMQRSMAKAIDEKLAKYAPTRERRLTLIEPNPPKPPKGAA